jgi:D-glycero-alpha-D-manno-heptose-7-phosphate kinase
MPPTHRIDTLSEVVASAPARVDLAGGWTDVPPYTTDLGGAVCNVAIELRAVARVQMERTAPDGVEPPVEPLLRAAWQRAGAPPVTIALHSTIPIGSGLGGSSAAGVALAAALAACTGTTHTPQTLAELSRSTETETMGVAGGCQDHFAAAFGGALLLRCGAETTVESVAMSEASISAFEAQAIVAFTGESRMSSNTIVAVLDAYRAGDAQTCDALHTMASLAPDMAAALRDGDIDHLGALIARQWSAQRALHPTITTPLIDQIVADAHRAGALGTKALGASGGGCVLVIAPAHRVAMVRVAVQRHATLLPLQVARRGVVVHSTAHAV